MKLELIRRSMRHDYICYGTILEHRPNKIFKIYFPSQLIVRFPPERFISFCSVTDIDTTKHTCHKCGKTYPRFQYAKHAKRFHK